MSIELFGLSEEELKKLIKAANMQLSAGISPQHPDIEAIAEKIKEFATKNSLELKGVMNALQIAVLGEAAVTVKGPKGQKAPLQAACKEVGLKYSAAESIPDLKKKLADAGYKYEGGKAVKV